MFKHADRHNAIKLTFKFPIILHCDLHRQISTALLRQLGLLYGYRHSGYMHIMMLGHPACQPSPTTSNIQHLHSRLELQFGAYHLHLCNLCLIKATGRFPESTAVIHVRIEHLLENVIADIVMLLAYLKRPGATLAVKQAKADEVNKKAKVIADLVFKAGPKTPRDHLIKRFAIPPAIHIGFAQPQRAIPRNSQEKIRVMHLHIPGVWPIDLNTRRLKHLLKALLNPTHCNPLLKSISTALKIFQTVSLYSSYSSACSSVTTLVHCRHQWATARRWYNEMPTLPSRKPARRHLLK